MHISNNTPNTAVQVRKACKKYGQNTVLHELDMTVPVGSTYALLGSSGCGKTTLLSTLVGLRKLSGGIVQLFGQDVSKTDITLVGYMPQESGLHSELKISEELHYFGRLYGLDWTIVEERLKFLVKLLQLPDKDPVIQNLSGGETRRVSLAVSLLHKPRLLILDEPTVGVDPLLRQNIWEYLYELVREEGTTIILSTHYTEEARQADVVSVMRHGRLLVEENPQSLMARYGCDILEDIVVKLARSQELETSNDQIQSESGFYNILKRRSSAMKNENGNIVNVSYKRRNSNENRLSNIVVAHKETNSSSPDCELKRRSSGDVLKHVVVQDGNSSDNSAQPDYQLTRRSSGDKLSNVVSEPEQSPIHQGSHKGKPPFSSKSRNWWLRQVQIINAISILNFITYIRHPVILYIMLIAPANTIGLIYYVYKPIPNTDIGVVNLEQSNCFQLPMDQYKLGCELSVFLHESGRLKLEEFTSEESAMAAVNRGSNYGYIVFPSNFSRNMVDRVAFGRFADRETLDGSSISVYFDYSNYVRNGFLLQGLASGFQGFIDKKLNDTVVAGQNATVNFSPTTTKPFKINEKMTKSNAVEATWAENAAVPQIAWYMAIIPAVLGVTIVWDKKRGVFQRTLIGGGSLPHLFIAAMGIYFLIYLVQTILNYIVVLFLNIPFKGSALDFFIVNYGQSLIGLSYGFLLGIVFNQEIEVIFCILALSITCSISQGITSLESVEEKWVRWLVFCLPTKVPTISVENIMFRGWNFSYPEVWHCFIVQGAWIFSCLGLTALNFYTLNL